MSNLILSNFGAVYRKNRIYLTIKIFSIMRKVFLGILGLTLLLSSCVSQKKYAELEEKHKEAQDLLNSATVKLNDCLEEKATATSKMKALEEQNAFLKYTKDIVILTKPRKCEDCKSFKRLDSNAVSILCLQFVMQKHLHTSSSLLNCYRNHLQELLDMSLYDLFYHCK